MFQALKQIFHALQYIFQVLKYYLVAKVSKFLQPRISIFFVVVPRYVADQFVDSRLIHRLV